MSNARLIRESLAKNARIKAVTDRASFVFGGSKKRMRRVFLFIYVGVFLFVVVGSFLHSQDWGATLFTSGVALVSIAIVWGISRIPGMFVPPLILAVMKDGSLINRVGEENEVRVEREAIQSVLVDDVSTTFFCGNAQSFRITDASLDEPESFHTWLRNTFKGRITNQTTPQE